MDDYYDWDYRDDWDNLMMTGVTGMTKITRMTRKTRMPGTTRVTRMTGMTRLIVEEQISKRGPKHGLRSTPTTQKV